jgi:hypothetical protein
VISIKHPSLKLQGQEIALKNCVQAWRHDTQRNDTQSDWQNGTAYFINCKQLFYMIMILDRLSVYTSMKYSILQTLKITACTSIFRHPVLC